MSNKQQPHFENDLIRSSDFYGEYQGHKVEHLGKLLPLLRSNSEYLIWTSGDSSLDNKFWFNDRKTAVGGYRSVLSPPSSVCDTTYWLNYVAEQRRKHGNGENVAAVNAAVEATTLNERWYGLKSQDKFLQDNISSNDVLIVSIGGNDVAMAPTPCTILSLAGLLCLPVKCIEHGVTCCTVPVNDYCFGCGPSLCSCAGACPPCLGYFRHLFGTRVQKYIEQITSKTKPAKILVCMIYYLDENKTESWAGKPLEAMGYDSNPSKLQTFIRKAFVEATSRIKIQGSEVIPVPLFHVLDGKTSSDYVARVEPSAKGGMKMAEYLLDVINNPETAKIQSAIAPTLSLIHNEARG